MDNNETPRGTHSVFKDILPVIIGEIIVSALVVLVYLIVQLCLPEQSILTYKVATGVILGSAVIILNYLFLSISVNRAVDKFMEMRGTEEMDEEEAAAFAQKNAMAIQNTATRSYIIRMLSTVVALVCALLIPNAFEVIATAVPLLMFKPILYITEFIKQKRKA